jgi:hypothetical protein
MFQDKELASLRLQKQELVLRSELNRRQLLSDWQQLHSSDVWLGEGVGLVKRHPVLTAALAAAAGMFVSKLLRRSGSPFSGFGLLEKIIPIAGIAWRLFQKKNRAV